MATATKRGDLAVVGQGSVWDGAAYWPIVVGVYLMVGGLFFYSGKEKLFDDHGHPPAAIKQQFSDTFIGTFHRNKSAMQVALAVALVTFACFAFGQTSTGQFSGSASLHQYFGATVVTLILVSLLPPNRSDRWLRFSPPEQPDR